MEAGIEGLKTTLIVCIIIFIAVVVIVGLIKYLDKQFTKQRREKCLKDIIIGDMYATTISDISAYDNPFIEPETYFCIIDDVKVNHCGEVWVKYHYCDHEQLPKHIKYNMDPAMSFLSNFTKVENVENTDK